MHNSRVLGRLTAAALIAVSSLLAVRTPVAAAAPPNDHFAQAQVIAGFDGETAGTTVDATDEYGGIGVLDVWYAWTASETRTWYVQVEAPAAYVIAEIGDSGSLVAFGDTSAPALCGMLGEDDFDSLCRRVAVTAGTTYRIRVEAYSVVTPGVGTAFTLRWFSAPPNDERLMAATIAGSAGSTAGTTAIASNDATGFTPRDVWYAWMSPSTIEMLFELHAPGADMASLQVTDASAPSGFFGAVVDCAAHGADPIDRICLRLPVDIGAALHIRVVAEQNDSPYQAAGLPFTLIWHPVADVPANDLFANAQLLAGSEGTVTGSTISASGDIPPNVRDVWYAWSAAVAGPTLFTFEAPESSFYGFHISVGADPSSLTDVGEVTTCGFYGEFDPHSVCFRLDAVAGTTYHLRAIASISPPGVTSLGTSFTIMWRPLPANDRFDDALPLVGLVGSMSGTTVDATAEPFMPPGRDVWYTFTAPSSQPILFDLKYPAGAFPGFAVGHPPDIFSFMSDGTTVDCAAAGLDPIDRWCILVNATAGTQYHILVLVGQPPSGLLPSGGPFVLSWRTSTGAFESLCELTMVYADHHGIGNSLCAKLAVAQRKGGGVRANLISAYINEVQAQTGKAFTQAEAATLIATAQAL